MHSIKNKISVDVPCGALGLKGDLSIPTQSYAIVLFAHGSGSSRLSPRNQMVADFLNSQGIATFLFDLLTEEEDRTYANRFNIMLLSQRLKTATEWLAERKECKGFRMGYFGASTGAAAALIASTELPVISAVVSRGGRPDLAMEFLPLVKASTLLIVGSSDTDVVKLNQQAFSALTCDKQLEIVAGATHLFEEKGAMEKVCVLAANWFEMHLQPLELLDKK